MGLLSNLRIVDPILTTISRGYQNEDLISELLFPIAEVEKEGGKIPTWGKEQFKIWQTERAIKADSNEMELPWVSTTSYDLTEHDLTARIDSRELAEADLIDLQSNAVITVVQAIQLRREKIAAELAFTAANYADANKKTYADDFLNEAAVDPIAAIDAAKQVLRGLIGKEPNTMIMGPKVWRLLKNHTLIKGYFSNNESQLITKDKLKDLCELEQFIVANSLYTTDDTTFTDIWGNFILLAYVKPPQGITATPYQPSFGYTLRKKGHPFSSKWTSPNGKINFVQTTDIFDVKIVGAESGYLITNPVDPSL